MGLKSGEYVGKKCTIAPTCSMIWDMMNGAIIHDNNTVWIYSIKGLQLWNEMFFSVKLRNTSVLRIPLTDIMATADITVLSQAWNVAL